MDSTMKITKDSWIALTFLAIVAINSVDSGSIVAECGATEMKLTLTPTNTASTIAAISSSSTACLAIISGLVLTLDYTSHADCFTAAPALSSTSTAAQTIKTNKIWFHQVSGVKSANDDYFEVTCTYTYTETDYTTSYTATDLTVGAGSGDDTAGITPVLTFVDTSAAALVSSTVAFDIVKSVCAEISITPNAAVLDINIKSFEFDSAAVASGSEQAYVTAYCVDSNVSVFPLITAPLAFATSCSGVSNCPGKRYVCFTPFHFGTTMDLHVRATVKLEKSTGYSSQAGGSCTSNTNIGRKKRETVLDDDDVTVNGVLYFNRGVDAALAMKSCETTTPYMISAVVFAAAFVLTTIAGIFASCTRNQNNNKVLA